MPISYLLIKQCAIDIFSTSFRDICRFSRCFCDVCWFFAI